MQVLPEEFSKLVAIADDPLVVHAPARGMFSRKHRYLMSWRGLAFYTASLEPLDLGGADTITAKSIWIPQ